jgi:hypothetical protein
MMKASIGLILGSLLSIAALADDKKVLMPPQAPQAPSSADQQAALAGAKEMMIIPPHARSQDFKEAFDLLKQIHSADKVNFFLKDNSKLSGILDITVLPGGTMLNFKMNTTQGIKYRIIRVEDISSVAL